MEIQKLLGVFARHPGVKALAKELQKDSNKTIQLSGLQGSCTPLVFASLQPLSSPFIFILDDEEEAGYFYHDLTRLLGDEQVLFFPSSYKRAIRFGQRNSGQEILRTEVLSRLGTPQKGEDKDSLPLRDGRGGAFIVTYPEALCELVVTKQKLSEQTLSLSVGEHVDIMFVQETLLSFGFNKTDYVYEPGQFAVRGSIIDVYSYSHELPYRIDFFGDEVDSIRTFEVHTQLSRDRQQNITLIALPLSPSQKGRGDKPLPLGEGSSLWSGAGGGEEVSSFLKFLPEDAILVTKDLLFLCESVERTYNEGFSRSAVIEQREAPSPLPLLGSASLSSEALLVNPEDFKRQILDFKRIELKTLPQRGSWEGASIQFGTHPQPVFHKNFDLLIDAFKKLQDAGTNIYILADSAKQTDRLESIFSDKETSIRFTPVDHALHEGFIDDDLHVAIFTDHQIFDRYHRYSLRSDKATGGKVALTLKELQQFEIGDYVVHIDYGVGRFGGLVRIPIQNNQNNQSNPNTPNYQEVIKIIYSGDDTVYVSIHSLHKVSKYKGKEGEPPRISKLGTGAWERMKERTKKKIKDIARDLILLYSRRREEKGFAFSGDSFMQHELEASFLYEDTPDQLKATHDVKADMERQRPMDRLVCGDVGFGKTEVAVRAAFKACADNKQVAVLVPTTVLAYQHYHTFMERLKDFPVKIEYLTRARTPQQTKEILEGLKNGSVNIIIGTHKLIGKSVQFKDLGLLIIDEEQKFGVSTKEKLRQLKVNVDTLTLTATPIPRTLQFSLMGARDLSVIQTPPPNRYPIQTQLCQFNAEVIAEAINFEMSRSGQVFFVNNRISQLPELAEVVRKHVPDARVAVAHGQMPPEELEKIMVDFMNYDYDVLVSTTIIESGLDIPNANTIIINGAHNFGLSDLHQMRGRVGRSNKKAFCYLLSPPLSALNIDARRRLQAIENFSDLGSGIHIAMQDLDIRGAGNLLGAEQSGFIADLGYETYQKILSQAVTELRNDEFPELNTEEEKANGKSSAEEEMVNSKWVDDCQLDSNLPMYFSEDYVPTSSERMLLYRELDGMERDEDVERFRQRLIDRFGPPPQEAEDLLKVVTLRRLGKHFGCERIVLKNGHARLFFGPADDSPFYDGRIFGHVLDFATANAYRCHFKEDAKGKSLLIDDVGTIAEAVDILKQIKNYEL
ncbi:MAG: transcription-repair coupling factor [Bacteroidaceae bacterium]|nr:transcription-repair coupling factor [Bacteroidaceae bacterium]